MTDKSRNFFRTRRLTSNDDNVTDYIDSGMINWSDVRAGSQNPKWRSMIASHQGATTEFSGDRFIVDQIPPATASTVYQDTNNLYKGNITVSLTGDLVDSSDTPVLNGFTNAAMKTAVVNRALAIFYNKAQSAMHQMQGGVFVGELKEALNLIKRPGRAFRELINNYHRDAKRRSRRIIRRPADRLDPSRVIDANKVVSDTWLEYSFGMAPLLSDVRSGAEALARLALDPNEYVRIFAYFEQFRPASLTSGQRNYTKNLDTFITYRFANRRKEGYQCKYIGEVRCTIDNPFLMRAEVLGFSGAQFVPTIWELIPYSFLVDYFSNIGDVINAWSFPRERISWYNRSLRSLTENDLTAVMVPYKSTGNIRVQSSRGDSLKYTTSRTFVERTGTVAGLGLPEVTFEIPGWSTKWLNIGALAHMRS